MKTKITILFTKTAITLMFLVCAGNMAKAQKTRCFVGGGLETYSSGNLHGGCFTPYLNLTHGRKSFSGGPVIQNQTMELSGGKLMFSYNLSGSKRTISDNRLSEDYAGNPDDALLQLNAFCFAQYLSNTKLSRSASTTEKLVAGENSRDWSNVRLSTAEAGAGFELYVKFSKRVSWKTYIGGSVYYHTNYIQGMYHERACPVLVLGTGIHICPL
ncbi:MAG: hypothetical protein ACXVC7_03740 [Bacteroidia bacterium]